MIWIASKLISKCCIHTYPELIGSETYTLYNLIDLNFCHKAKTTLRVRPPFILNVSSGIEKQTIMHLQLWLLIVKLVPHPCFSAFMSRNGSQALYLFRL